VPLFAFLLSSGDILVPILARLLGQNHGEDSISDISSVLNILVFMIGGQAVPVMLVQYIKKPFQLSSKAIHLHFSKKNTQKYIFYTDNWAI